MVVANSTAYVVFWNYVRNREIVMAQRVLNRNIETNDDVIRKYSFTSPWRWVDRTSQDYIKRLYDWRINKVSYTDVILRTMIYRIFNKPGTFNAICEVAPIHTETFNDTMQLYIDKLSEINGAIYSHAYTYRTYGKYAHGMPRYEAHIRQTADSVHENMMQIIASRSNTLHGTFDALKLCSGWGDFMALQVATDLGYSDYTSWNENDWITASVGSIRGLTKIFPEIDKKSYGKAIQFLWNQQKNENVIPFCSTSLSLMDIQNCLCEADKYMRVVLPELTITSDGTTPRYRPERLHRSSGKPMEKLISPPKYNIQEQIDNFYRKNGVQL